MTTILDVALLNVDPKLDRIRNEDVSGWREFQTMLALVTDAIARFHGVEPNSDEYLELDPDLEIGPEAERRLNILKRILENWHFRNDPEK